MFKYIKTLIFGILGLLLAGCTLEKESAFNRSMQNLTAHYNILFNANSILQQKQEEYALSYVDAYDRFLSVYQDTTAKTTTPDKMLESVITRANTIINDKTQSHYIGDAYLILGKANYMEANFFNAIEFLNYTIATYPKQKNLVQEARVWKARALMRINQLRLADTVSDTALINIFPKQKNIADVYATRLQYDLYTEKYTEAEEMAKRAIRHSHDTNHKLRWRFILAQLQEQNRKPDAAAINYTRIENSNAPFEMSFNASLNRIRIQENQNGHKINRIDALRRLLRDDKNKDFIDQIYYQIGELYLADGHIDEAVKNFKLSIRKSTKNQNQKGLSYLRIADIDFKNKADYTDAKKYYDSTLTALSPNYPGYQAIYKKSNNLQLLTDKLQIIAREDTLQMLAKMNPSDRNAKIAQMANNQLAQQKTIGGGPGNMPATNMQQANATGAQANATSNFYFYSASALSQGFTDFKRVWGNRQLADNWRRSAKSTDQNNVQPVAATVAGLNSTAYPSQTTRSTTDVASSKIQQDLLQSIPLTSSALAQSNARIINAYTDIANFYRDILDDRKEAINTYEELFKRFPNPNNKAYIYYNLYRFYSNIDAAKSDRYKNLILTEYPESNYAKVIKDPDFNQKLDDQNAEFTAFYNQLFDLVSKRQYNDAVAKANELISEYSTNNLTAQVYYLRAIAMGHSQTLAPFKAELEEIADKFPDDRLVTPLVKQHLAFIDKNKAELAQRPAVLVDSDPNEVPFGQEKYGKVKYTYDNLPAGNKNIPPKVAPVKAPPVVVKPPVANAPVVVQPPPTVPVTKPADVAKEAPSIFSLRDTTNFYFVINVSTNTISLAPSRFGIGQFNRANLPGSDIKHQLKVVADHQLIYIGRFGSLAKVKAYARAIVPLLPDIMKVPADKYNFFIITQENLDKLADKKTLDSYFDFYQKKY